MDKDYFNIIIKSLTVFTNIAIGSDGTCIGVVNKIISPQLVCFILEKEVL